MKKVTRKHYKLDAIDPALRDQVNRLLSPPHNYTYAQIAEHLTQMGVEVGKSSVHRWHSDIKKAAERVHMVREQVSALVVQMKDNPTTELTEVATELIVTGALESLAKGVSFDGVDPVKMGFMVADLQRSTVAREKLKLQFRERAEKALALVEKKVEKVTKKKLDPETMQIIRQEIYGLGPAS